MVERAARRSGRRAGSGAARPEPVGGLIRSLLSRLGIADKVERASVIGEWAELVGPHIAKVARPTGVRGRTLFVEVESAAWRTELTLMRPELMRKLNAGKRRAKIEKIVFLQADGRLSEARDGRVERKE
jgi:predicted nucleic acid-binding Zn ribbon protein